MSRLARRIPYLIERGFVLTTLLFFTRAVTVVLANPGSGKTNPMASDKVILGLQALIYLVSLVFIFRVRVQIWKAARANPLLLALLGMVLVSSLWSYNRTFSLRRAITFELMSLVGFYLGCRFSPGELARYIRLTLVIVSILSVVFVLALPLYGLDVGPNSGDWRGVFSQKNILGRYMVVALLTVLAIPARCVKSLAAKCSILLMCFILLAGSRSAGAVVVFGVMLGILACRPLLLVAWRRHIPVSTVAIVAGSIIILTAVIERGFLLSLLGRGSSLSGRVPLWKLLYSLAAGHEWLGFGYASFWPQHAGRIWLIVHWTPHTAHNGYLDFYLSLGLIGLALFLAHTVVVLSRFMAAIKKDPTSPITYWMFMMFILVCLCNIFENELLIDNNFLWVFYVAMCSSSIAYKPQPRVVAVSSVSAKLMEACA